MVTDTKPYIDPKEFFHPDDNRIPADSSGFIGKYLPYVFAIAGPSSGIMVSNYYLNRPVLAGPLKHVVYGAISVFCMLKYKEFADEKVKRQNHFIYTYIRDHPDEFPLIERQKFADFFEAWRPCR